MQRSNASNKKSSSHIPQQSVKPQETAFEASSSVSRLSGKIRISLDRFCLEQNALDELPNFLLEEIHEKEFLKLSVEQRQALMKEVHDAVNVRFSKVPWEDLDVLRIGQKIQEVVDDYLDGFSQQQLTFDILNEPVVRSIEWMEEDTEGAETQCSKALKYVVELSLKVSANEKTQLDQLFFSGDGGWMGSLRRSVDEAKSLDKTK